MLIKKQDFIDAVLLVYKDLDIDYIINLRDALNILIIFKQTDGTYLQRLNIKGIMYYGKPKPKNQRR